MTDAGAWTQARRLVLCLIRESGRGLAQFPAVRVGAVFPAAARARRVRRSRILLLDELGRDLLQELRGRGGLILAEHASPVGAGQHQPRPRASHPDIEQAPLFFKVVGIVLGPRVREEALLEAAQRYDRKLQPLGGMQRHQQHARVATPLLFVDVRKQRQAIDEATQRGFRLARLVFLRRRDQLHQVLNAAFGLLAALLAKVTKVAGLVEDFAEHDRNRVGPSRPGQCRQQIAKR